MLRSRNAKNFHESFEHVSEAKAGSARSFGFVFVAVFLLVGLWPIFHGEPVRVLAVVSAVVLSAIALLVPRWLEPLNVAWMRFGLMLGALVSPVILALLFYAVFAPVGFVMRLFGKDSLHRRFEADTATYWIERRPTGDQSMRNQF